MSIHNCSGVSVTLVIAQAVKSQHSSMRVSSRKDSWMTIVLWMHGCQLCSSMARGVSAILIHEGQFPIREGSWMIVVYWVRGCQLYSSTIVAASQQVLLLF